VEKPPVQTMPQMPEVAPAEPAIKEKREINPKVKKAILVIFISLILIVLGGGLIYVSRNYLSQILPDSNPAAQRISENVFLEASKEVIIPSQRKSTREIVRDIRNQIQNYSLAEDEILEIIVTKIIEEETEEGNRETKIVPINALNFFQLVNANVPEYLLRGFGDDVMIGLHKYSQGTTPFVLIKIDDTSQVFGGMLEWEPRMVETIRDLFYQKLGSGQAFDVNQATESENININDTYYDTLVKNRAAAEEARNSTTTIDQEVSTGTTATPKFVDDTRPTYDPRDFEDVILSNKDTRAIKNSAGEIIFFYSLIDDENLLMTTNRETLDIILDKINIAKLVR
jgi:hypothetical protein